MHPTRPNRMRNGRSRSRCMRPLVRRPCSSLSASQREASGSASPAEEHAGRLPLAKPPPCDPRYFTPQVAQRFEREFAIAWLRPHARAARPARRPVQNHGARIRTSTRMRAIRQRRILLALDLVTRREWSDGGAAAPRRVGNDRVRAPPTRREAASLELCAPGQFPSPPSEQ